MGVIISGIQQLGVGNVNTPETFAWYAKVFGTDVKVFEEAADAALMLPYTSNEVRSRHAILAINIQSGGGFEIWQYTKRTPLAPENQVQAGDLGIYAGKIWAYDVEKAYYTMREKNVKLLSEIIEGPDGKPRYYMEDLHGNVYNVVEGGKIFKNVGHTTGGVAGAVLGVSDIEASKKFYNEVLGYDTVLYEGEGNYKDMECLPGGNGKFKRVILTHSKERKGPFSPILGASHIELIQSVDRKGVKIFEGRDWGDLGFIHLCFDIQGMSELKAKCEKAGHPFTVDSSDSFDMGEAAGHFTYVEDPDGALIEFVETHKVPIMKKLGWYVNLKNRNPEKSLPTWMLKAMGLNRVKVY